MDFRNNLTLSLGLRNNNPGNLRPGDDWQGMIGSSNGFIVFADISWGIRAWLINYHTQLLVHRLTTVGDFIKKYAPASENNVAAYLAAIKVKTGLESSDKLPTDKDGVIKFFRAVALHENGPTSSIMIDQAHIEEAFSRLSAAHKAFFLPHKVRTSPRPSLLSAYSSSLKTTRSENHNISRKGIINR